MAGTYLPQCRAVISVSATHRPAESHHPLDFLLGPPRPTVRIAEIPIDLRGTGLEPPASLNLPGVPFDTRLIQLPSPPVSLLQHQTWYLHVPGVSRSIPQHHLTL